MQFHLVMKLAAGERGAIPNISGSIIEALECRGPSLKWRIVNFDVVMKPGHNFQENKVYLEDTLLTWVEMNEIIRNIDAVSEITICSLYENKPDHAIREMVDKREWSCFEFCADLFDSTEWIIYSNVPQELSSITSILSYDDRAK